MTNLTKAMLHLLDGGTGNAVFSELSLDLADDVVYGYVSRQLERAAITTISGFAKIFQNASRVLEV